MIDLHCHIIPWIDDGADNAAVACEMAVHALNSDVKTIVATPHCNLMGARPNFRGRTYNECISIFRALLRQHNIPIEILPGAELFAHPSNLRRILGERRVMTLNNSRYLLVEFNFTAPGEEITDALELISRRSLVPVVAHPERYAAVQHDPSLVARWFRRGYIIQVNKGSILGRLGEGARAAGIHLLRSGLIHVIASDAHDAYYRPTGFQSLLPVLRRLCPQEYIDLLLLENPKHIIEDRRILPP